MPPRRKTRVWYIGAVILILGVALIILAAIPYSLSASWYARHWLSSLVAYPLPEPKAFPSDAVGDGRKKWRTLTIEERVKAMEAFGIAADNLLKSLPQSSTSTDAKSPAVITPAPKTDPSPYWLIIPSLSVNMPIVSGESDADKALRRGAWLMPGTPTPLEGGNTVLTGHRFLYTSGARTLYHLDKAKMGDEMYVEWNGTRYTYKVFEKNIVPADDVSILNDSDDTILTIITCDPPYSTKNRLYVRARLVQ